VRLDKQAWAEEKAAKGEAALQQGPILSPAVFGLSMNCWPNSGDIVSDRAQKTIC